MGLQDQPEGPPLAVKRRQELGAPVRRHQQRLHQSLQGSLFRGLRGFRHAGLEVPARTMGVAQARASRAGTILRARLAQGDITQ
jgi:hypothetical protein